MVIHNKFIAKICDIPAGCNIINEVTQIETKCVGVSVQNKQFADSKHSLDLSRVVYIFRDQNTNVCNNTAEIQRSRWNLSKMHKNAYTIIVQNSRAFQKNSTSSESRAQKIARPRLPKTGADANHPDDFIPVFTVATLIRTTKPPVQGGAGTRVFSHSS